MQSKSSELMPFFIISFPTKTKISQRRDMNFWKLGNELIKLIA